MAITPLCLMLSTLSIVPNRTQFFLYDKISLKCTMSADSNGWSMWRNVSATTSDTFRVQRVAAGVSYDIPHAYPSDSGVYWCESPQGECSNKAHITVTAGTVILESPVCASEGDLVTLRCLLKKGNDDRATSDFTATFFKDEVFIGSTHNGRMDLPAVSHSDEGLYGCKHPEGDSPKSFLAVTACAQETGVSSSSTHPPPVLPPIMSLPRLLCTIFLLTLYSALSIICLYAHRCCTRA
ncbi:uncharacterized protein LOC142894156 isoform X2 [Nelusetta ayraudi]|uniref:uncharacterized protein LOC142894156 isoform X2 n=1 Tax=Nelusetta ayraudi TaxID=303726 RepID=UPI003F705C63